MASSSLAASFWGQDSTAKIGVDKDLSRPGEIFHQKVTGKTHADHGQCATTRNLDVHQRQRNGNTLLAFEHVVQIAVAWVIVLLVVARELFSLEKQVVQGLDVSKRRMGRV